MELLLYTLGALLFTWAFSVLIRKHSVIFFVLATLVSLYGAFFTSYNFLNEPYLGFGFLIVTMYGGALDLTKWYAQRIKAVRGKIAIIGFILIFSHVAYHFSLYFQLGRFLGSLAFLVMIPLFITSFKVIKSRIRKSKWDRLHKLAYLAYFLIFAHGFLMASSLFDRLVLVAIFGSYLVKRLLKAKERRDKRARAAAS